MGKWHDLNLLVGEHFYDNSGNEFEVIEKYKKKDKAGINRTVFDIKYINSGYIIKAIRRQEIQTGELYDVYAPSVCGVACKGNVYVGSDKTYINRYLYETWKNMIARCYNSSCRAYKWYGAKSITVCDKWLCFENFFNDAKTLPGYNEQRILNGELDLDKDILGGKIYSPDTCQWITKSENRKEAANRKWA